ncbi:MAG: UPF0158 family protein [Paludibacter sp.]
MNAQQLLDEILGIIRTVKDNKEILEKILEFLEEEIYIPEEEIQLPQKYTEVVNQIAGSIDAGLVCYLNPDTLETDGFPQQLLSEIFDDEENEDEDPENKFELKYTKWEKYITIEPLESNESFEIMEKFTDRLNDSKIKIQLINALNNRKPFANFKRIIDNSSIRQEWFDFKDKYLRNYVKSIIQNEIIDKN